MSSIPLLISLPQLKVGVKLIWLIHNITAAQTSSITIILRIHLVIIIVTQRDSNTAFKKKTNRCICMDSNLHCPQEHQTQHSATIQKFGISKFYSFF